MGLLTTAAGTLVERLRETGRLVMIQHTVFALPFAVIALVSTEDGAHLPFRIWWWVAVAMVSARTAAMAFNRLVDHRLDALNPRTAGRSLPAGRLGRGSVWLLTAASAAVFVVATGQLNQLCLLLAAPTLAVLLGYSFAKRCTWLSHLWLGAALGIAPVGAWIAATGRLDPRGAILAAAVTTWVAGFDIIYSLQDEDFDRRHGLRSLPAAFGASRSLQAAQGLHIMAFLGFAAFAMSVGGGPWRIAAVVAAGALLLWQHRLVAPDDLRAVDAAFFTANGVLAVVMCALFLFATMRGSG